MGNPKMEGERLPKDVIICGFGSAFSTLTVMLLDESIHSSIQREMNELEVAKKLEKPKFTLNEEISLKDRHGDWIRARIRTVHDHARGRTRMADIVLQDTKQLLSHVEAEALVATPPAVQRQKSALPYFISGLEPNHVLITHRNKSDAVTAPLCAEALNMTLRSKRASLSATIYPSDLRSARFTRIFVATLTIEQRWTVRKYIENFLKDYVIMPQHPNYFDSVRHPDVVANRQVSILVPYVSEKEICEVVSLRKIEDGSLKVGLRLLQYTAGQEYLFERLLGEPFRRMGDTITPLSAVCIYLNGISVQRGVLLESGKVLGVDTLEFFEASDENIELTGMPHSLANALPHSGLFIDWNVNIERPCVGDSVLVTNLRPQRGTDDLLQYSYDAIQMYEQPTVIAPRSDQVPAKRETVAREQPRRDQKQRNVPGMTVAEWYGPTSAQAPFFERVFVNRSVRATRKGEAFLSTFGEIIGDGGF